MKIKNIGGSVYEMITSANPHEQTMLSNSVLSLWREFDIINTSGARLELMIREYNRQSRNSNQKSIDQGHNRVY